MALHLDLEGYEGPLDVLLNLAREQKVDLAKISILKLAEQYLEFIREALKKQLELAAEYLVMAAWLAYLKSRLLLPLPPKEEGEITPEEMAENLAFQLRRLESMQNSAKELLKRPRLGKEFFACGAPEGVGEVLNVIREDTLYDLLKAYADFQAKHRVTTLEIEEAGLFAMEDALEKLEQWVGDLPEWKVLLDFLPDGIKDLLVRRSALASSFTASLELARQGKFIIMQTEPFGPIYLRKA